MANLRNNTQLYCPKIHIQNSQAASEPRWVCLVEEICHKLTRTYTETTQSWGMYTHHLEAHFTIVLSTESEAEMTVSSLNDLWRDG